MNKNSLLATSEALLQNPENVCPEYIYKNIGLMEVRHYDFEGRIKVGQLAINSALTSDVESFFTNALDMKFPINKVVSAAHPDFKWNDELLMADNASSGFNYRLIAGTNRPSLHAQGLAFDINPLQNPYVRYEKNNIISKPKGAVYNPQALGTLHIDHPLVKLMEGFGWEWGGRWTAESGRTDYQHFQKII